MNKRIRFIAGRIAEKDFSKLNIETNGRSNAVRKLMEVVGLCKELLTFVSELRKEIKKLKGERE